jgi:cob(I)alamin adenosyltransferase
MSKIYTKAGDTGMTTLPSGQWAAKSSDIVEVYGCLDELNCFAAFAGEALHDDSEFEDLVKHLYYIQRHLFDLGLYLAAKKENKKKIDMHNVIAKLEHAIDIITDKMPLLDSFVLPGGGEAAARLHLARAVCRRAERAAFKLAESNKNAEDVGIYLNRLSDWFYVAARYAAYAANIEEITV